MWAFPMLHRSPRDQMVRHVLTPPLKTRPGETFAYCNFGYALLAAIVEVASGKSFEDYLKEKLFKPAGLVDTGFIQDKALDARRVSTRLSDRTPEATALDWHWGWGYRGMGGVVTTALDLLRWDRALRGNKILDEATKAVAYTPYRDGYACGWKVEKTERNTTRCHHSGGVAGYAVNYVRDLEEDLVVVVLSNGKSNLHEVTRNVDRHLFPMPQLTATLDFKSEDLGRLKSVVFPRNTTWRVQKGARSVFLTLHPRGGQRAAGTITLPPGYARKLGHELEQALRQKGSPEAKGPARMEAGFFLRPYVLQDGRLSPRGRARDPDPAPVLGSGRKRQADRGRAHHPGARGYPARPVAGDGQDERTRREQSHRRIEKIGGVILHCCRYTKRQQHTIFFTRPLASSLLFFFSSSSLLLLFFFSSSLASKASLLLRFCVLTQKRTLLRGGA